MRNQALRTALVATILTTALFLGPAGALAGDTWWEDPSADYAYSGGGFDWPDNAYRDDAARAEAHLETAGKREHVYQDYDLGIPECAEIHGIEVRLDWFGFEGEGTDFYTLGAHLSWNGGTGYSAIKKDTSKPTDEHTAVLGGPTDTWGHNWTPDRLSDANFRVRVAAESTGSTDFYLRWVPVRVYYTPCGAVGGIVEPLDRVALLAPWLAVAGLLALAVVPVLLQRRQRA
jgi:hypothetical protein